MFLPKELKATNTFQKYLFGLLKKISFLHWNKKRISENQLTHFESKELWVKIKNSLQLFN
jgi:hypothetical protein